MGPYFIVCRCHRRALARSVAAMRERIQKNTSPTMRKKPTGVAASACKPATLVTARIQDISTLYRGLQNQGLNSRLKGLKVGGVGCRAGENPYHRFNNQYPKYPDETPHD